MWQDQLAGPHSGVLELKALTDGFQASHTLKIHILFCCVFRLLLHLPQFWHYDHLALIGLVWLQPAQLFCCLQCPSLLLLVSCDWLCTWSRLVVWLEGHLPTLPAPLISTQLAACLYKLQQLKRAMMQSTPEVPVRPVCFCFVVFFCCFFTGFHLLAKCAKTWCNDFTVQVSSPVNVLNVEFYLI